MKYRITKECRDESSGLVEKRRVRHQVVGRVGVEAGHPDQTAPADVVASPVERDVQRGEVARLPPEELGDVHGLQKDVGHVTGVPDARLAHWRQQESHHKHLPASDNQVIIMND